MRLPTVLRALALLLLPGALVAQTTVADSLGARPISLADAVAAAQQNSLGSIQARGQVRTAESSVRSAKGALLPSLNVSLGQVNQSGDRLDSQGRLVPYLAPQPWTYSTGLSSTLNLFDGGRRISEVRRTRFDVASAEANQVTQEYNIALQVKVQYYAILAAREQESAALAQLSQADQQLRASIARTRAGVVTMSDSLRSVIAVGNARLALITARNNVRIASAALTRLIGSDVTVTAIPSDTLDTGLTPIDSATLVSFAARGPAVRQAEAQLESARGAIRSAKSSYLPNVDLTYSRSGNGYDRYYGLGNRKLAYTNNFAVRLSYALFNNFSREDAITRANVQSDLAQASLRDARLASEQTLAQQLAAISSAQQRIDIQTASLAAAREDLRVQQQRYALGASTLLDVLTSQTTLDAARAALIQARQDVRVARAQLEALVGRDLP